MSEQMIKELMEQKARLEAELEQIKKKLRILVHGK
jgi:hypothetical protein